MATGACVGGLGRGLVAQMAGSTPAGRHWNELRPQAIVTTMGYSTNYKLSTIPASEHKAALAMFTQLCDDYDPFRESCKWYEHERDASTASCNLPGVIIRIDGAGEDAGDEWTLYAFEGETVKHKREPWTPPPPPETWTEQASTVAERRAAEAREREIAELRRLREKYPNA